MAEGTTVIIRRCLDRLKAGDETGRTELLTAASERLGRLARKMFRAETRLRRWEDTADVFQAAMLRLLRRLQNVTPASPRDFFRLAAGEIRRELIDLARHHFGPCGPGANHDTNPGGTGDADTPSWPDDPADAEQCPSRLAEWGEFHERVGALPDVEQEAFDLVWYQGLSHVEAAEVLGVCPRTVKRRWHAACLKLESALGGRLPIG
jgi:RNA polymerase sigma-70 factor (ECF subfamily)